MSQKLISFFERIARNLGSLLLIIFLLTATVFALSFWDPGNPPGAEPGSGNVQLSNLWKKNGSDIYYNDGNVGIGIDSPGTELQVAGDIKSTRFFYDSDERLKKDIEVISNSLKKINQLTGVSFKWKDESMGNGVNLGLIAQNVEEVFPELVVTDEVSDLKSVQYSNLVAPLIEAVKELTEEIENLENRVSEVEKKILDN